MDKSNCPALKFRTASMVASVDQAGYTCEAAERIKELEAKVQELENIIDERQRSAKAPLGEFMLWRIRRNYRYRERPDYGYCKSFEYAMAQMIMDKDLGLGSRLGFTSAIEHWDGEKWVEVKEDARTA